METNKLYLNTKSFVLAFDEYLTGLIALDSKYINIKSGVINDEIIKKYKSKHNKLANEFFTKVRELTKSGDLNIQMENFKVNSDESKIKNYSKVMSNDFERLSYRLSEHQQKIVKSYSFLLDTSIGTTTYFSGLNILFNHLFGVELSNNDNQLNKSFSIPEPKKLFDFFDELIDGEYSDLETYNYIDEVTNNFDEDKIKIILKDLELYLFASKMELENDFNLNDLVGKDKQYKTIDEIPYTEHKSHFDNTTVIHYDYEKLFYPHRFFNHYRLKKLLKSKLKSYNSPPNQINDLLNDTQKKIIDKLIQRGFKDVHVYRFLKDEKQFITITQKEFNKYMIDNHHRKYKPEKRITSIKDISIPRELIVYFNEITA